MSRMCSMIRFCSTARRGTGKKKVENHRILICIDQDSIDSYSFSSTPDASVPFNKILLIHILFQVPPTHQFPDPLDRLHDAVSPRCRAVWSPPPGERGILLSVLPSAVAGREGGRGDRSQARRDGDRNQPRPPPRRKARGERNGLQVARCIDCFSQQAEPPSPPISSPASVRTPPAFPLPPRRRTTRRAAPAPAGAVEGTRWRPPGRARRPASSSLLFGRRTPLVPPCCRTPPIVDHHDPLNVVTPHPKRLQRCQGTADPAQPPVPH